MCKKCRKTQRKGRCGKEMKVVSVRWGMFGACSDLVPDYFWLQWFWEEFDVVALLGKAVAVG